MVITFAIAGTSFGSWASRIPSLKNQLGLEAVELGGVLLVLAMASVVSFPLSGRAIDRYGAVRVTRYSDLGDINFTYTNFVCEFSVGAHRLCRNIWCLTWSPRCLDEWLGCRS